MPHKTKSTYDSIEKSCKCHTDRAMKAGDQAADAAYNAADFVALSRIRAKKQAGSYHKV